MAYADTLVAQYRLVLPDARGHGDSAASDGGYGFAERAADLLALIEYLGLQQPLLLGHSMGAETAFTLATQKPGLVRALMLEDPPWRTEPVSPEQQAALADTWQQEILRRHTLSLEAIVAEGRTLQPTWPDSELVPWARAKQQVQPQVASLAAAPRVPWQSLLAAIRCPTLLLCGDLALGAIVTPSVAAAAREHNPHITVATIAGAGHCVRRDQPAAFAQAVQTFLQAL
jgi:N-formylmaleamate deformylase